MPAKLQELDSSLEVGIFFDPWVLPSYYYPLLPYLILLYDRIFTYFPSDRWLISTQQRQIAEDYLRNFSLWVQKGVIVPVIKGEYPANRSHIPKKRLEGDRPSESFIQTLCRLHTKAGVPWVSINLDETEAGREQASQIIKQYGKEKLKSSLKFQATKGEVPDLALFYGEGNPETTLFETIASYANDDVTRFKYKLGEYLLPPEMAYQYKGLSDLISGAWSNSIFHQIVFTGAIRATEDLASSLDFSRSEREKSRLHLEKSRFLQAKWLAKKFSRCSFDSWKEESIGREV